MATLRKQLAVTAGAMRLTLAVPLLATAEQQGVIAGTVVDFHGKYELVIRDARGALANVTRPDRQRTGQPALTRPPSRRSSEASLMVEAICVAP